MLQHWKEQPNYTLLVDTEDRPAEITYVPQENITPIINTEVRTVVESISSNNCVVRPQFIG